MKKKGHEHKTPAKSISGLVSITGKGTGYLAHPDFKEDIEIERADLNTALNRDEVLVKLLPKSSKRRQSGEVTKVIKRNKTSFVGVIEKEGGAVFLRPDDRKMYTDILVIDAPQTLVPGMKALVKMKLWTDPLKPPEGTIVSVIGKKGDHNAEMRSIVLEKGFDVEFPPEVEREAEELNRTESVIPPAEITGRKDFRKILTFTIDPADAKDFDDALSFREIPHANSPEPLYEIGVHIADVSHYVREGTALDAEAVKRGFSVYLVDRTIPMLPEVLSNDICSLNPDVDRLTFSAVFTMTGDGKIKSRWFGKTVIHSAKRFSYEDAQAVLDAGGGTLFKELDTLSSIAKKLREEKMSKGAIDFEQDEVKIILDENYKPIRIVRKERLETHKLIEEYMLLANKEVAEFMYRAHAKSDDKDQPFIYRIHDLPDPEKIAGLAVFLKALGYHLPIKQGGRVTSKDLQVVLKKLEGKSEESIIKTAAVRSMAKAIYSTGNIGHFGLAFEYYTHFTSPIRRYADLLVHRLLFKHLKGEKVPPHEYSKYHRLALDTSEKEIAAAEAERNSKKYKQVEYMMDKVGQEFDGTVTGVTEWGMYVEEANTRCEGMIKLRDLGDDYYILNEKTYSIVGEKTKKKFSIGDKIRIKVAGADLERKTLDYTLVQG